MLPAHVRRLRAPLAIAGLVDGQHTGRVGGRLLFRKEQFQSPLVDLVGIPGRLAKKPLQLLGLRLRRASDRLGVGQRRERLVALRRQKESFEVAAEGFALAAALEQVIEGDGEVLQRTGSSHNRLAVAHGAKKRFAFEEETTHSTADALHESTKHC